MNEKGTENKSMNWDALISYKVHKYHVGHIKHIAKIIKVKNWATLSIPKGGSILYNTTVSIKDPAENF